MGSFGIQFSDNFSRPVPQQKNTELESESGDGFFQKSLAYSSYYTMLFVAYCMITPEKMEMISNNIGSFFS